jgi:photosystem II stability/assembly factor-like uncharacterized protein
MTEDREMSQLMRTGMAAVLASSEPSGDLPERMITAATARPGSAAGLSRTDARSGATGSAWQRWWLPAVAAIGAAVLIVAAVFGVRMLHSDDRSASVDQPVSPPAPSAPVTAPTPQPTPHRTSAGEPDGAVPAGFRAVDLTWVSTTEGWALGTAPCAQAPCTSIVRTDDGGRSWVGVPAPIAELTGDSCNGRCVSHLRFANRLVGYAFGPDALFMTTDGGRSWNRQPGGAYALEISDDTVLRVVNTCIPGCPFQAQRSAIGSTSWQLLTLPAGGQTVGVQLVRNGSNAVIATFAHVTGGAGITTSTLFTSADDGTTWAVRKEPCPQTAGSGAADRLSEVDTTAVAVAGDASLTVLCTPRAGIDHPFTMTSTDGGAHFSRGSQLGATYGGELAAASASMLLASTDVLYRSTDGGNSWHKVSEIGAGPGRISFVGFESTEVACAIGAPPSSATVGSATVWTSTDAGATWASHTFR